MRTLGSWGGKYWRYVRVWGLKFYCFTALACFYRYLNFIQLSNFHAKIQNKRLLQLIITGALEMDGGRWQSPLAYPISLVLKCTPVAYPRRWKQNIWKIKRLFILNTIMMCISWKSRKQSNKRLSSNFRRHFNEWDVKTNRSGIMDNVRTQSKDIEWTKDVNKHRLARLLTVSCWFEYWHKRWDISINCCIV